MKILTLINKLRFYSDWYDDMTVKDRNSIIGGWVYTRCQHFSLAIADVLSYIKAVA